MSIVYIILPATFGIALIFVAAFAWATRRGQFDDMKTPSVRMIFRDDD